jgi:hypothetical protein
VSPTANASSTIRISGLIAVATLKATRIPIPLEYVRIG